MPAWNAWQLALWPTDWWNWLSDCIRQEVDQRRLFPWIAVCFGLGIVLFFQADGAPALWAPVVGLCFCAVLAIRLRQRPASLAVLIALAAVFAGFTAAVIRTRAVNAPVLSRIVITPVSGFIESIDDRPNGKRLLLQVRGMNDVPEGTRPHYVRVTVRKGQGLSPGQFIEGTARLLPPPQPAWPGGYDFARDAFFREIGAVGSIVGAIRYPDPPPMSWKLKLSAAVDEARSALTQRIASAIGGQAGAVGAALVTGKRGLIEEPTNDVLRGAGIYHVVSISGLHMVLAAGTFFWLSRSLLALVPALALGWPIKKIAASIAMVGAVAYCVYSGSEVATERSLIMTLVMFGAILCDRPALSMRNLAIAALIVLAREPEAILGPSFQMSFGAVAALTACTPLLNFGKTEYRTVSWGETVFRWMRQSAFGLVGTTLIASFATAPFTAYHFQTLNPLGLIGNALALPLVSVIVMPSAVLGVLAYPFGLDRPIWQLMGLAVEKVLDVSVWVSGLQGATVLVPAQSTSVLVAMSFALLIATLLASSLRWLALIPASLGLAFAATPDRFDIFVDREGAGALVRGRENRLVLVGKPSGFVVEQWLHADGDGRDPKDPSLFTGRRCDQLGCVIEGLDGRQIAFAQDISALSEDCGRAAIIITPLKAPPGCKASLIIDRAMLSARGAVAARLKTDGYEIVATRAQTEAGRWSGIQRNSESAKGDAGKEPGARRPIPEQDLPDIEISTGEPD